MVCGNKPACTRQDALPGPRAASPLVAILRRTLPSRLHAFAIQHNNMPAAEFIAVITFVRIARIPSKILEVISRSRRMEFMVANRGPRAAFHAPPRLVITHKVFWLPVWIRQVPYGHYRPRNSLEEFRRRFRSRKIRAIRYVARSHQYGDVFVFRWRPPCRTALQKNENIAV